MIKSSDWSRRYPPLLTLVGALVIALFTLPSALNLPLANPGQTLEYAPVPGNGNSQSGGNFAGLGLGESSAGPNQDLLNSLLGLPGGEGGVPSTFQCVGHPPRQTEDPQSPPCVAFFKGNNGGSTYRGVTATTINIVVYAEGGQTLASCGSGQNPAPSNSYTDLDQPPTSGEFCLVSIFRTFMHYFNARYQQYGRRVHMWLYISSANINSNPPVSPTPQNRRADANANATDHQPFAVLPLATGDMDAYQQAINQHGVMEISDGGGEFTAEATLAQYAPLDWQYAPAAEEQAENLASYMCQKVVTPGKTEFSSSFPNGTTRKYGLLRTRDDSAATVRKYQDLVASIMQSKCGFQYVDHAEYPNEFAQPSYVATNPQRNADSNTYAPEAMAQFKRDNVTTIIWPAGQEHQYSVAANKLGYFPEWITGGDGNFAEGNLTAQGQDQSEWRQAVIDTPATWVGTRTNHNPPACDDAWNSVGGDPGNEGVACGYYDMLRLLWTGIQVAGPRLTPQSIDQGFHAIPPHPSTDPTLPACYFDPGDYTCQKDGTAMWWDPTAQYETASATQNGCWRMFENGKRYFAWKWPPGDVTAQKDPNDVCNGIGGSLGIELDARP